MDSNSYEQVERWTGCLIRSLADATGVEFTREDIRHRYNHILLTRENNNIPPTFRLDADDALLQLNFISLMEAIVYIQILTQVETNLGKALREYAVELTMISNTLDLVKVLQSGDKIIGWYYSFPFLSHIIHIISRDNKFYVTSDGVPYGEIVFSEPFTPKYFITMRRKGEQ